MALGPVTVALLSSLIENALESLISSQVVEVFRRKKLNLEQLEKMKILFLSINKVINDADNKQVKDPDVKAWYEELKQVMFDVEEVLDEINTNVLRSEIEDEFKSNWSKRLKLAKFSFIKRGWSDEVNCKINNIIGRLQFIVDQKDVLGLEGSLQNRSLQRVPSPLVEASAIYGRDDERKEIIKCLLSDDISAEQISVISIVGMGGIGKTTLAQLVYNDESVKEHFDIRAWITVSDEFDIIKIMKTTIEILTSQKCCIEDLFQLQVRLKQALMLKRFLLVFDDVWNENYNLWDVLKSPLESGAHGSKIIMTTRIRLVATMMGSGLTCTLEGLAKEDCWKLFTRHVFNNVDEHSDMVEIGREIVEKCKGHPLAIKSLAGVLRSMQNRNEWVNVLQNGKLELQLNENFRNNILPALWLSYCYLPKNLKRCFAFCSIFPKDYEIQETKLILLWMAEGLLQPTRGKSMEDVGKEYFQDLISRSLFQQSVQDESTVTMHDLVHDLAAFVAGESCVRLECDKQHEIPEKVRSVSYTVRRYKAISKFDSILRAKSLRSFLLLKIPSSVCYISNKLLYNLLPNAACLRVLSLSNYTNFTKLPNEIGNMKYLRYLDLSDTSIEILPASINTLYNLQTLKLSNCSSLTQLPSDMGRLINLRHLFIEGTSIKEMPPRMGRLKNLRTLKEFPLGKGKGSGINELKHLGDLRGRLCVSGLENVVSHKDALEANFKDKKHLEELILKWNSYSNANDYSNPLNILEKLQPHRNLRKLVIVNYGGGRFPNWLGDRSFEKIESLSLESCMNCFDLPPLGQLPFLKELSITSFSQLQKLGSCFYGKCSATRPFRSLEILKIEDMATLEEWFVAICENDDGPFPCLRELHIGNCPKLSGDLPRRLPSLTELVIVECQELKASLPEAPSLSQLEVIRCTNMILDNIPGQLHLLTIVGQHTMEYLLEEIDNKNMSLESLNISDCPSLRSLLAGGFPSTLKGIEIRDCKKLELSMDGIYTFLKSMTICSSCDSLTSFSLDLFPNLDRLHIKECPNLVLLVHFGEFGKVMTSLSFLQISRCSKFESFPKGGLRAPNLKGLRVEWCNNLKSLPDQMDCLSLLQNLYISGCPKLLSFPEGGLPSSLLVLSIFSCEKFVVNDQLKRNLKSRKRNLKSLSSLQYFSVGHVFNDSNIGFALKGLLPSSLVSLHIDGFRNMRRLEIETLQGLTSLKELRISNCEKLESIPVEGLPSSLEFVEISDCYLLKKSRRYWDKIAQNVYVKLDNEVVSCD